MRNCKGKINEVEVITMETVQNETKNETKEKKQKGQ